MGYKIEDISLDIIRDFIENGNPANADPGIVEYLERMEKVRAMCQRIDQYGSKDHVVAHLVKVDGLSYHVANNLYYDTQEYFNADRQLSKEAWRGICLDKMTKVANLAMLLIKDVSDAAKVHKMWKDMNDSVPEAKEEIPDEMFLKPFKLYAMDAEFLGLPAIDRQKIAAQIDALPELSEKERELIKREAGNLPIKLFLNEQEDARKS